MKERNMTNDTKLFLDGTKLDNEIRVPISKKLYESIKQSKVELFEIISIEEAYAQILDSYIEFEEFIFSTSQHHFIYTILEYDYSQDSRMIANRRVLTCLNTIFAFKDQVKTSRDFHQKNFLKNFFKNEFSKMKMHSISYQFAEQLRNYTQHQSQPIDSLTVGGGWDETHTICEQHATVYVNTSKVFSRREIKKSEQEKFLNYFGSSIDVSYLFREVLSEISNIVKNYRIVTSDHYIKICKTLDAALNLGYKSENGKKSFDLVDESTGSKSIYFNSDFLNRAHRFRDNSIITNYEKHYTSTRPRRHRIMNEIKLSAKIKK